MNALLTTASLFLALCGSAHLAWAEEFKLSPEKQAEIKKDCESKAKSKLEVTQKTAQKEIPNKAAILQKAYDKTLESCMALATATARDAAADKRLAAADKRLAAAKAENAAAKAILDEMEAQNVFFHEFLAGKRTREEYNQRIRILPDLIKRTRQNLANSRIFHKGDPETLATIDSIEKNILNIEAQLPPSARAK